MTFLARTILAAFAAAAVFAPRSSDGQDGLSSGGLVAGRIGCGACHDPGGSQNSPSIPYIDGQKRSYLTQELRSFSRGETAPSDPSRFAERAHPVMEPLARTLTDRDIEAVAAYYAGRPCVPQRAAERFAGSIPAKTKHCANCHGDTGVTLYVFIPNLGGQKKDYLIDQLLEFRATGGGPDTTAADSRFHRMMASPVADLTDSDIVEIAEYYSRQSCRAEE